MRLDQWLHRSRLVRTRTLAQRLVEGGLVRRNGARIDRPGLSVKAGDILTLPLGKYMRIVEILALPDRRGPAAEAQTCYRMLDPDAQSAIAAQETAPSKGNSPP